MKHEKLEANLNPTERTIYRALIDGHEFSQAVLDTFKDDPDPEMEAELVKYMEALGELKARIESGDLRIEKERYPMAEIKIAEQ